KNTPLNLLGESLIYCTSDFTFHWIDCYFTPYTIYILTIDPFTGEVIGRARILEVPFGRITAIYFKKGILESYIYKY
ncbi:hypothetical protein DL95DRAFT_303532, partial [Leptodontidium sp. 2 PMI_412]